jgi:hypothetical protein
MNFDVAILWAVIAAAGFFGFLVTEVVLKEDDDGAV